MHRRSGSGTILGRGGRRSDGGGEGWVSRASPGILSVLVVCGLALQFYFLAQLTVTPQEGAGGTDDGPGGLRASLARSAKRTEAIIGRLNKPDKAAATVVLPSQPPPQPSREEEHGEAVIAPSSPPVAVVEEQDRGGRRVAMVIPYYGSSLPAWIRVFVASCAASASLVDYHLFLEDASALPAEVRLFKDGGRRPGWLSENVFFHVLGANRFARLHALAALEEGSNVTLDDSPLEEGSLALLVASQFRRNPRQLVEFKPAIGVVFESYLREYSHWAFGDLDILVGDVSKLVEEDDWNYDVVTYSFGDQWRAYARGQWTMHRNTYAVNRAYSSCDYLTRKLKSRLMRNAHYESSEGCYSWALKTSGLKVKYTVRAATDADGVSDAEKEAWVVEGEVRKCQSSSEKQCRPLIEASEASYDRMRRTREHRRSTGRLQGSIPVRDNAADKLRRSKCMGWVNPAFQLCLDAKLTKDDTILLDEHGAFSAFHGEATKDFLREEAGFNLASFFHFQEWKKRFKSFSTQLHPRRRDGKMAMLASKRGFIPIPEQRKWPSSKGKRSRNTPSREQINAALYTSEYADSIVYCAYKACDERRPTFVRSSLGELLRVEGNSTGVTLAVAGVRLRDLSAFVTNACDWRGPVVAALFLLIDDLDAVEAHISKLERCRGLKSTMVTALVEPDEDLAVPQKALRNLVLDSSPSRFTLLLGSPAEKIGPGSYEGIRDALCGYGEEQCDPDTAPKGTTLVLPAFTTEYKEKMTASTGGCSGSPALEREAYASWQEETAKYLNGEKTATPAILSRGISDALGASDVAPTLVMDALDHRGQGRLVRELDELVDEGCYDAAFVRSVLMFHSESLTLAPRAYVISPAQNEQQENNACNCLWEHQNVVEKTVSQKAASTARQAISYYSEFLERADSLRDESYDERRLRLQEAKDDLVREYNKALHVDNTTVHSGGLRTAAAVQSRQADIAKYLADSRREGRT